MLVYQRVLHALLSTSKSCSCETSAVSGGRRFTPRRPRQSGGRHTACSWVSTLEPRKFIGSDSEKMVCVLVFFVQPIIYIYIYLLYIYISIYYTYIIHIYILHIYIYIYYIYIYIYITYIYIYTYILTHIS